MLKIDGKEVSNAIYEDLKKNIYSLSINNIIPCLAVIIVGERKDSMTYVNMKNKKCKELGIKSILIKLNALITEWELLERIRELNEDNLVHGILVQLPLPDHIDKNNILESISIEKDVDGFHNSNMGKLALNTQPLFVPCTPLGVIELFKYYQIELEGKHVVMIGKSNIVGLPLSLLLLNAEATVTVCHIKTKNIKEITKNADILISACGQPQMIKSDWITNGTGIIDIGINAIKDDTKKKGYRLVGDVDFEDVKDKISFITPVPGGVGPMTIAMLMKQTVKSALNFNSGKILSNTYSTKKNILKNLNRF